MRRERSMPVSGHIERRTIGKLRIEPRATVNAPQNTLAPMIDHTIRVRSTGHRLSARTQSAHAVLSIPSAGCCSAAVRDATREGALFSACRQSEPPQPRGPQVPATTAASLHGSGLRTAACHPLVPGQELSAEKSIS